VIEAIEFVENNWVQILSSVTSIVGGFSVIASMTPNSADNRIVDMLMRVINVMGVNIGKSKNG
jgi:hypothetical protein